MPLMVASVETLKRQADQKTMKSTFREVGAPEERYVLSLLCILFLVNVVWFDRVSHRDQTTRVS